MLAFCSSSIILSNSSSPANRACALAMRGEEAAHPSLSRMNSILRLSTCCRFCKVSLFWCANENECRDSEGNRLRSSPNGIAGEAGPEGRDREAFRELAAEELADRISNAGRVGEGGLCAVLMRRKPLSRSAVKMGDLFVAGMHVSYCHVQFGTIESCDVPSLACCRL